MRKHYGFMLVEMVVVIAITGIVAGMVAVFIRAPVEGYVATARRAGLADDAETAARFMTRELQAALPNSVRVDPAGAVLEFVPVVTAGRYRADVGNNVADDALVFSNAADNGFDVLGPPVNIGAGESLVVYNLGIAGASVYDNPLTVRRLVAAGAGLTRVTFTATAMPLPFPSPESRFQIVGAPVSYACNLGAGTLLRYTGYGFVPAVQALAALQAAGLAPAVVATNVTACSFAYGPGVLQRFGLVSIGLTLAQNGERVGLQQQVNVDNAP